MKALFLKSILVAVITLFVTINLQAQISIFESPCNDSTQIKNDPALIDIAKYGGVDNPLIIIEPNSYRDRLDIKLKDNEIWDLLIFNCNGQLVRLGLLNPGKNKISLEELNDGIYFVYMSKGEERWVKKIEKE
jgi:hypothetical protein